MHGCFPGVFSIFVCQDHKIIVNIWLLNYYIILFHTLPFVVLGTETMTSFTFDMQSTTLVHALFLEDQGVKRCGEVNGQEIHVSNYVLGIYF